MGAVRDVGGLRSAGWHVRSLQSNGGNRPDAAIVCEMTARLSSAKCQRCPGPAPWIQHCRACGCGAVIRQLLGLEEANEYM